MPRVTLDGGSRRGADTCFAHQRSSERTVFRTGQNGARAQQKVAAGKLPAVRGVRSWRDSLAHSVRVRDLLGLFDGEAEIAQASGLERENPAVDG